MGALGLLTLPRPGFLVAATIVGGLYFGLAGAGHAVRRDKNASEWTAFVTDLFMFLLLATFLGARGFDLVEDLAGHDHGCATGRREGKILASSTARMPVRKIPSNVPAPPMDATGAPSPRILSRLVRSAPISVPMLPAM